jgi:Uma2 family endonuclease
MTQAMLPLAPPARLTVDDFLALPDNKGFELIDGVLVERNRMGAEAGRIAANVSHELLSFIRPRRLGYVFDAETTYDCFGPDANGRRAEVSYVRRERLPDGVPRGAITLPADLADEVVSPTELAYDVNAKVRLYYLRHGFGVVWVVWPDDAAVDVHLAGRKMWRAAGDDPVSAYFAA